MAIIKLSATEQRRLSAFFTCLVLAFFAWVFTVLSGNYSYSVKEVLNFKNTPQKRAFHSLQSDTVSATVNGNGWQMLFSKMSKPTEVVTIDLRSLEYKSYVVLSSQLDQINIKKEIGRQIISFNPDTLYFDFSNRKERRLPIQLQANIKYKRQFAQSGNISLNPGYVVINGPSNVIDKLTSWQTDTLKADSIGEPINTRINLQPVKEGNMSIVPKSVQVIVPVDEFTEKTLEVPVKLINNHNYDNVKIFPQKVRITFTTSLNRFAQMDEDMFEATADLDLWRKHNYRVLPVVLSRVPAYSRIIKIEPANIDFIIKN